MIPEPKRGEAEQGTYRSSIALARYKARHQAQTRARACLASTQIHFSLGPHPRRLASISPWPYHLSCEDVSVCAGPGSFSLAAAHRHHERDVKLGVIDMSGLRSWPRLSRAPSSASQGSKLSSCAEPFHSSAYGTRECMPRSSERRVPAARVC